MVEQSGNFAIRNAVRNALRVIIVGRVGRFPGIPQIIALAMTVIAR
jgi:hypothetical protein